MPPLNRSYGVALVLVILVGGFVHCKTPAGPFVTVTITGIPTQTTQLVMSAKLGDNERPAETTPQAMVMLPLTIDLPQGARGSLLVSAEAMVPSNPCTLFKGAVTVELTDDTAYEATLPLLNVPLANCMGMPTVSLTVNKVEDGGTGSVTSNLAGIDCATGCTTRTAAYALGTPITLTAQPVVGTQVKWSEQSCDTNLVCKLTLTADQIVTATFSACPHGSWCNEGSPTVATDLYGVWGGAGGSVYAVGDAGKILQRSAGMWVPMTSGVSVPLHAIGAEGGSATPSVGGDNGTLLTLNGSAWGVVALPGLSGKQITGITGEKNPYGNLFLYLCSASGDFYLKNGSGNWAAITNSALTGTPLHGVSATNNGFGGVREATIVGDAGFVFRQTDYFGQHPADNTAGSQTKAPLRGVWSGSALSVAVGDNGVIITRGTGDQNNATKVWSLVPTNPVITSRLNSVWGGDDKNIWIVGDGGVILKYDGQVVTKQDKVPVVDLNGVWAADTDPTHVYAVGKNGVILHYNQ